MSAIFPGGPRPAIERFRDGARSAFLKQGKPFTKYIFICPSIQIRTQRFRDESRSLLMRCRVILSFATRAALFDPSDSHDEAQRCYVLASEDVALARVHA